MPLTTRCSHCGRLFPVYSQQLRRNRGKLACPQCGGRFDAVSGLVDEAMPGGDPEVPPPVEPNRHPDAVPAPPSLMTFDEPPVRPRRARSIGWALGVLLLLLGLAAQLFWWERGAWLRYPQVRQLYERVCAETETCWPLPRLAGTMEILQPVLSEHPLNDRVLRLDLTLLNHSAQLQRPPVLQLELYNEDGSLVAARRFASDDYLPAEIRVSALAAGSATNLALSIASPPEPPASFRVRLY